MIELFNQQKANRQALANTTAKQRRTKLTQLEKAIFKHRQAICDAIWTDFKKPAAEVDLTEIYPVLTELRFARKQLNEWMHDLHVSTPIAFFGATSKIKYEPKGASLIIAPWNYPFHLVFAPLVSAIAAGCTVIIKPSEFTPNTMKVIKTIVAECFDETEIAVVEGGVEVATELLNLKFDHIFFTGSTEVGKIVMAAAAKNLASVTLELGGKSPTIVDQTADVKGLSKRIVWAKFTNTGQTCIAPDYILVHVSKQDELIASMIETIKWHYGQNALESDSYPRIINEKHHVRLMSYLNEALDQGARLAFGGGSDAKELYIQPTIIEDVALDSKILNEEIFGPVLPIVAFKTKEEAVDFINSKDKPLAMYIYSKSKKNIEYYLNNTSAGGIGINVSGVHIGNPNLPFGGVNHSGLGKSRGHAGFLEFSNEKAIINQKLISFTELLAPPYNAKKQRLINWILKYL
jgi:aldehyde dehydrogenase (NAD+)